MTVFSILFLTQCSEPKEKNNKKSPRKEVFSTISSPKNNSALTVGDSILFEIKSKNPEVKIDSTALIHFGNLQALSTKSSFKWSTKNQNVGLNTFVLNTYLSNGMVEKKIVNTVLLSDIIPETMSYDVVESYPHDVTSYTQGLLIDNGTMYENTGRRNKSFLKKIDLSKGTSLAETKLDPQYFGEGISIIGDKIFMLTWESRIGFVYDKNTLEQLDKFYYQTEGWGLTNVGQDTLVMSDGSNKLYLKNPQDFSNLATIEVYDNKGPIDNLNELEYIDGKVYANRYTTNLIYVIDLKTGKAEKIIDFSQIYDWDQYDGHIDYLNGIAYDRLNKNMYVTGKLWPFLFKIRLK